MSKKVQEPSRSFMVLFALYKYGPLSARDLADKCPVIEDAPQATWQLGNCARQGRTTMDKTRTRHCLTAKGKKIVEEGLDAIGIFSKWVAE